jgi:glycosyltransferase involved in cell wall biosynthesis
MKLVIISHKECWASKGSPSGYATIGGFPFQMEAISALFDQTTLIVPVRRTKVPNGARPLEGRNLQVRPLPEPSGDDLRRKIALLAWLPRHLPAIWRMIRDADAVHAPVPGDLGAIGILVALAQRKPLFVRHCGTWGRPGTVVDRLLLWLLERIAGGRNVVMATGGASTPPSRKNSAISWIFSTTLSQAELLSVPPVDQWQQGEPLRLVTVGRLTKEKNAEAVIRALSHVREAYPHTSLSVVGEGPYGPELKRIAVETGVDDAVTFHGNLSHDEVLGVLSGSHVFVFPTRVAEGFPKSVLEAMACGLAVVATPVSVIPHLLGERGGVLLSDPGHEAVAQALFGMIRNSTALAEMSRTARAASRNYTLEQWGNVIRERLSTRWGQLSDTSAAAGTAEIVPSEAAN